MTAPAWQIIVDELQAEGWAVDWGFVDGLWQAEAIHATDGKYYLRRDASLSAAFAGLQPVIRGRLPALA
jgi:hypothetical protein